MGSLVAVLSLYGLWLAAVILQHGPMVTHFPGKVQGYFSDGPPRWRCAWALDTQLLFFPGLLWLAHDARGGSRWWSSSLARDQSRIAERTTAEWVFIVAFPTWLLLDFVIVEVRLLMATHHAVCIFSHLFAMFAVPSGFLWYMAGAIALEMGSAVCNLFCLWPASLIALWLYLAGMTISNIVACACMTRWVRAVRSVPAKFIGITITLTLAIVRQREAFKAVRV